MFRHLLRLVTSQLPERACVVGGYPRRSSCDMPVGAAERVHCHGLGRNLRIVVLGCLGRELLDVAGFRVAVRAIARADSG